MRHDPTSVYSTVPSVLLLASRHVTHLVEHVDVDDMVLTQVFEQVDVGLRVSTEVGLQLRLDLLDDVKRFFYACSLTLLQCKQSALGLHCFLSQRAEDDLLEVPHLCGGFRPPVAGTHRG